MNTPTTFPFIKIYKPEDDSLINVYNSLGSNITRDPRIFKTRPVFEQRRVPDGWEPAFFNVVAPTSVETLTGLGRTLSQLPGEIRNIIYSYLLSTGHLHFLRASKALYVEGSGLMAEKGVYRVSFGSPTRINYLLPSQRIVDKIRNLDICTDLSYFGERGWLADGPQNRWLLEAFGEPGRPRGQCSVTLEVYSSTDRRLLAAFCRRLRIFSDFETVIVRAEVHWFEPDSSTGCPLGSLMGEAKEAWMEQCETATVPWSVFRCRYVYDLDDLVGLRRYFGEGLLKGQDESSLRMIFHPRKAQEELGHWINRW